ncbi:DUF5047 domain-containing protein [Streptomyces sp. NPDC005776]|uniref:DUF5047 domain-containing protein n=1 Tax=Streptomyces sp. NPDC005776 TaxID=3154676 RepID=UPI0033DF5090
MLASTPLYKSALQGPHQRVAYVDVHDIDNNVRARAVPILSGDVTATLTNRVTRQCTFELDASWFPTSSDDALAPEAAVARVYAGTRYPDGSEEVFPLFTGRVNTPQLAADGRATFQCDDLANDVIEFRFEAPETAKADRIQAEIRRLILDALPQAVFDPFTVPDAPTPPLAWDEDRGQALDDLSEALGGRWYALGDGTFTVRPFSYALGPIVAVLTDGAGGLVSAATIDRTRNGSANSIVVVSERTDGTEPVRVVARDVTPGSPSRFGGPYGRVSQVIKIQTPLSATEAQTLARTQLAAATALLEQWTTDIVPDYTLEPGDTARLGYRGHQADQVIDSIRYPLMTAQPMTLGSRSALTP